jgi:D-aminopeptidase
MLRVTNVNFLSVVLGTIMMLDLGTAAQAADDERPRARDIGLVVGVFPTGEHNAITDVSGVRVGHATIIQGDDIRSGVTAIIPAPGNLYTHPIPARIYIGNGYGKLIGLSQVHEFGELESPVLLTCTLCVWKAADALRAWTYLQPGMGEHTINPVVGEVNDSVVNNMWSQPVQEKHVFEALNNASGGAVEEGSVGGGTGSQTYHWKGGIGTSSRVLPESLGGYTVGVLVQSNLLAGATLTMNGAPVGRELNRYAYQETFQASSANAGSKRDGSIMMVVATDAPLDARTLDRLAMRSMMGIARTGSVAENGSGDYVIAFSTHPDVRRPRDSEQPLLTPTLLNSSMDPLFTASVEATEEAVYNALLRATTVESSRGRLTAIPIEPLKQILEKYRVLNWDKNLPPHGSP